jgi:aquaporin related protein
MDRAPTMNIHKTPTTLSRVDPLKHVFRGIFDALPDGARGHVVAIVGEFLGTLCFIFFAFAGGEVAMASSKTPDKTSNSTQTSLINPSILLKDGDSPPTTVISPSLFLYVSLSAGFSLLIFAWIFFRVSGGLFNPVVRLCTPTYNVTNR